MQDYSPIFPLFMIEASDCQQLQKAQENVDLVKTAPFFNAVFGRNLTKGFGGIQIWMWGLKAPLLQTNHKGLLSLSGSGDTVNWVGRRLNNLSEISRSLEQLRVYNDETAQQLTELALSLGYRNFFSSVLVTWQWGFSHVTGESFHWTLSFEVWIIFPHRSCIAIVCSSPIVLFSSVYYLYANVSFAVWSWLSKKLHQFSPLLFPFWTLPIASKCGNPESCKLVDNII